MPVFRRSTCVLAIVLFALGAASLGASEKAPSAEELKFFETKVRPVLANNCYKCHGVDKQSNKLRLDGIATILAGGESGKAIVPGKPKESLLIEAINYESLEMPPDGKLKAEEITALTEWVKMGAPWPSGEKPAAARVGRQPGVITREDRAFWSFAPLREGAIPSLSDNGWSRNAIDLFIFDRLHAEGLVPAGEANARTLVRRLYFDLHGLPPTPAQVDEFLTDESADAYERLVERLLASPRYGERWGRHWLDLVRYGESDGYRQDAYRPHAWRYRDYVIEAFNADKPYNRFAQEQLAGDELFPGDANALVATGYLRLGLYEYNQRDVRTAWSEMLNDMTDVTADVFLGLGMSCARCHDHKFDPILQRDYFRLQAFFAPLMPRDDAPVASAAAITEHRAQLAAWEEKTAEIRRRLNEIERPLLEQAERGAVNKFPADIKTMIRKPAHERTPLEHQLAELGYRQPIYDMKTMAFATKLKGDAKKEWEDLRKELSAFDTEKPAPLPFAYTVSDVGAISPPTIIPGDREERPIEPGYLTILDPQPAAIEPLPENSQSSGRRAALARWITRSEHPLATRVIVNRIWQYHFGQGLVSTASDFGRLGEPPSHPELLDYLARRFVERGWSLKDLHRLILTSATYRQAAVGVNSELAMRKDPGNRWLWRMNVRRLDAEPIRDAMLAASGELNLAAGGPGVDAATPRRSVYTKIIRNTRDPLLDAFDVADGFSSFARRNSTTTANQALLMINGDWTQKRAQAFARRLKEAEPSGEEPRVALAYRLAYSREPSTSELNAATAFLAEQAKRAKTPEAAWIDLCHVLLNSNEFLYID
jgi:hypothetical protein